jgi:CMP-N-acetylneuraminic acid synthetase
MRSLGVILARGSSKRLPRKNIALLNGYPLIAYMIGAALSSKLDRVIVSTEDAEIAKVARQFGAEVPFMRPDVLAQDYASDADILLHAHDFLSEQEGVKHDVIVQLQPTTPFVKPETISACIDAIVSTNANCCFTARKVTEPPQWMFSIEENGNAAPLLGREIRGDAIHTQLLKSYLFPSGAAYAVRTDVLRREKAVFVDPLRVVEMDALRAVDIDEKIDLMVAEAVAREHGFVPFNTPAAKRETLAGARV